MDNPEYMQAGVCSSECYDVLEKWNAEEDAYNARQDMTTTPLDEILGLSASTWERLAKDAEDAHLGWSMQDPCQHINVETER
jgi:hypothetical protein